MQTGWGSLRAVWGRAALYPPKRLVEGWLKRSSRDPAPPSTVGGGGSLQVAHLHSAKGVRVARGNMDAGERLCSKRVHKVIAESTDTHVHTCAPICG